MRIKERLAYLNQQMKQSLNKGISHGEILVYESALSEIRRVSEWLKFQCRERNKIFFERTENETKSYIEFQNTTGMDFRFIAMEVSVLRDGEERARIELAMANWKNGELAKLYLHRELKENEILSFNPDNVEYQLI